MTAANPPASAGRASTSRSAVPARARTLAAQLAALFECDQRIVGRLNDAQRRLLAANDRLCLAPSATLGLDDVHWQVHRAFCAYQSACEERRQLAIDVGELSWQLTDALTTAGYTAEQARSANVHQLAAGTWRVADNTKESER